MLTGENFKRCSGGKSWRREKVERLERKILIIRQEYDDAEHREDWDLVSDLAEKIFDLQNQVEDLEWEIRELNGAWRCQR